MNEENVLARHLYIQMIELGFFHQIFTLIFSLPYIDRVLEERGGRTKKVVHVYKFVFFDCSKAEGTSCKVQKFINTQMSKKTTDSLGMLHFTARTNSWI